ncbi:MAG: hypothetical protein ACYC4R_14470 [Anaerolineae bacterium]
MWWHSLYQATTLFSLKASAATSSGGKTLLAPTPYALKMALLDVACRQHGVAWAEEHWPALRDLRVAWLPSRRTVVTNLFARVLKPSRNPVPVGEPGGGPLGRTIGYREYVQWADPMGIALALAGEEALDGLPELMAGIAYLGKRGGFVQMLQCPAEVQELPAGYVPLNPAGGQTAFDSRGVLQQLDDCGPALTFERASIYSGKALKPGVDRISYPIVIPYRLVRASKAYTQYVWMDDLS